MTATPRVSVVIPCLNEAENIEEVVTIALDTLRDAGIPGEVVVADNGSTDGSAELATAAGARVVHEARRGYGSAYLAGFAAARGDVILMGDADLTYDFRDIPRFLAEIDEGADLVMGNRMKNIKPGAMPWLHRYIGNPLLTGILNLFFRTGVRDAHCGMRALKRSVLPTLEPRATGMEFASEMVIRASKEKLRIHEIDIQYHPRGGESKLSTFRDGWRHLRFLLVHSPTYLFIIPGLILLTLGVLMMLTVETDLRVLGREWDLHALIGGSLLSVVGIQILGLGACARTYGYYFLNDTSPFVDAIRRRFRLEHGLVAGLVVAAIGAAILLWILITWADRGLGGLSQERLAIVGATIVIIGLQVLFTSFLISIIGMRRPEGPARTS